MHRPIKYNQQPKTMKSLSDLSGAESSGSTSDSGSDDSGSDLPDAFHELPHDPDLDNYRERRDAEGWDDDNVVEMVKQMDEDAFAIGEEYRRWNDINRINANYLRGHDNDYTAFTSEFYYGSGDKDNPGDDSYNGVQDRARDSVVNLIWYKALYPEPVEAYWDSEAVEWHPRPGDDTAIFVEESWAKEMADFAVEIDGEMRPVPPSNSELEALDDGGNAGGSSSSEAGEPWQFTDSGLLKVNDLTVDEIREAVKTMDDAEAIEKTLNLERNQKDRKTAKEKIERRLDKVRNGDVTDYDDPDYECSHCDFETNDIEALAEHDC